jgi:hypothetical protein
MRSPPRLCPGAWLRLLRWQCRLALCLPLAALAPAHAVEAPELKVAIVYNILQFVEWPSDADNARGVLTLCVDSSGQLGRLFKSLAGRPVQKRQLEVAELSEAAETWKACHAVFLDGTSRRAVGIAARLPRDLPLLVMGDLADVQPEAMVQLVEAGGRVAFNIDLGAARRSRLQVSSRLLKLAKKVTE